MADTDMGTGQGDSGAGVATDFEKVTPLNPGEDPAHENFLPDPDERETTDDQQRQPL